MAPVLLSSTQISKLLKKLEDFENQSLQVRTIIQMEEQFPSRQFQVWVDVWPEFTTVLLKQRLIETHPFSYYAFSLVKENLKKLLKNTDIVELENAIFRVFPFMFHETLEDVVNEHGLKLINSDTSFQIYKINVNKMKESPVPEDFTVGYLTPDMADQVTRQWVQTRLFEDKTLSHITHLIKTYPSVCVCDSEGTPVAYELGQEYGGLGMLFVDPAYRRRGLGKLVTNLLLKKYIDFGYYPYVGVGPKNAASHKLHGDVGFEKTEVFCEWAKPVPK